MGSNEAMQIEAAAAGLKAGRLVVLPTETLYGVAASAADPGSVALLRDLITVHQGLPEPPPPATWHASDAGQVRRVLGLTRSDHLQALEQLLPGPVRLVTQLSEEANAKALATLGVQRGVIERDGLWSVRVPECEQARRVIELAGVPVLIERLSAVGLGDGVRLPDGVGERAAAMGIAHVLDIGPTRFGGPSTPVALSDQGVRVIGAGVYEARYIQKKMARSILFVCTGNTCRSPMAEAIARDLIRRAGVTDVTVASAGVAAGDGMPMTAEARQALTDMGFAPGSHRSRMLELAMVNASRRIFTLTKSHQRAVQAALPPAEASKVELLDPQGEDVPDPIGGPLDEYRATASAIERMVKARLKEMGIG